MADPHTDRQIAAIDGQIRRSKRQILHLQGEYDSWSPFMNDQASSTERLKIVRQIGTVKREIKELQARRANLLRAGQPSPGRTQQHPHYPLLGPTASPAQPPSHAMSALRSQPQSVKRESHHDHQTPSTSAGQSSSNSMNSWRSQPQASRPELDRGRPTSAIPPPAASGSYHYIPPSRVKNEQSGPSASRTPSSSRKRSLHESSASGGWALQTPSYGTSSSRPPSRDESTGSSSSVIDLTGDDEQITASIKRHKSRAGFQSRLQPNTPFNGRVPMGNHPSVASPAQHISQNPRSSSSSRLMPGSFPEPSQPAVSSTISISSDDDDGFEEDYYGQRGSIYYGSQHGPNSYNRPSAAQIAQRNGAFIPSDNVAFSRPVLPPLLNAGHSGLSAIVNRTNNYDYANMLDDKGRPLDHRYFGQEIYEENRATKEDIERLLESIVPDATAPDDSHRDETPDGLKSSLYKHQVIALDWMKKQEDGLKNGGILADDMGLGKTISTLSLILARPAKTTNEDGTEKDKIFKTNLIVAPLALVRQWEDEIKRKVKDTHQLTVNVFHGSQKLPAARLTQFDVVLTTYQTLLADYNKWNKFKAANADRTYNTRTDSRLAKTVSLFHPDYSKFHRIILDESQMIKNRKSKCKEAAVALKADYRWCLSGTPMMNSVEELYPLFEFLRIRPYSDHRQFVKSFGPLFGRKGSPKHTAVKSLQIILKATMLRRSKKSEIDGQPILKLPPKTIETVHVVLEGEQLEFYQALMEKAQLEVNKYLGEDSINKHMQIILVWLLRLRQSCCHPWLLMTAKGDDLEAMTTLNMVDLAKTLDPSVVVRILDQANQNPGQRANFECPVCYEVLGDPMIPLPCGHEICAPCLDRVVADANANNLREGQDGGHVLCVVCRGPIDQKRAVTYKAFKKAHVADYQESDDEEEEDQVDEAANNAADQAAKDADGANNETTEMPKMKDSKVRKLRNESKKNNEAYLRYMAYLRKNWISSVKVDACLDILRRIKNESDGEKTIVFSQWTMLLDLLEVAKSKDADLKDVGHRRYDGAMSMPHRDAALAHFRDTDDVKILFVSLRAGNAGLNLVAGSRVIMMDPFWNPYIESQAVDRTHRIGQVRDVKVYRILIKDTIEDRIMEIQENKQAMVDAALDEGAAKQMSRLSVQDIKRLFNSSNR